MDILEKEINGELCYYWTKYSILASFGVLLCFAILGFDYLSLILRDVVMPCPTQRINECKAEKSEPPMVNKGVDQTVFDSTNADLKTCND